MMFGTESIYWFICIECRNVASTRRERRPEKVSLFDIGLLQLRGGGEAEGGRARSFPYFKFLSHHKWTARTTNCMANNADEGTLDQEEEIEINPRTTSLANPLLYPSVSLSLSPPGPSSKKTKNKTKPNSLSITCSKATSKRSASFPSPPHNWPSPSRESLAPAPWKRLWSLVRSNRQTMCFESTKR